jgi:virulence factor Mce-like protein
VVTKAPTPSRIIVMVLFALSCFGLLLFLWVSFGGTTPLATKGYRFDVVLPAANNIAQQADVRISGVPVGKVVAIGRTGHYAKVTQQIEPRYVPLPSDIRVALRRKTLLGETYIELTPGSKRAPPLKEGATLPVNHAQQDVPLDQILNTFDPKTRQDLRTWLAGWAVGVKGRAPEISDDFSHFTGVLDSGNNLLGVLEQQRQALSTLIRDTGTTFGTIGDTNSRVSQLVTAGDSVFRSTASQAANLTATFEALPGAGRARRGAQRRTRHRPAHPPAALRRPVPGADHRLRDAVPPGDRPVLAESRGRDERRRDRPRHEPPHPLPAGADRVPERGADARHAPPAVQPQQPVYEPRRDLEPRDGQPRVVRLP